MMDKMSGKALSDYYPTMYQDGYAPYEILNAAHRTFSAVQEEHAADVNLSIEVKNK